MQEFRLTVIVTEYGHDDEAAEKVLDAFMDLHPDAGAVVTQNRVDGSLSITVGLEATDPWAASALGQVIIGSSLDATGLAVTDIVDLCISSVDSQLDVDTRHRELVPA